jgi:hypothetical protein
VKSKEVLDGYQRKMKEIYIAQEASWCYSDGVVLILAHPLLCIISGTAHGASVIHTVKKPFHISRTECHEI